MNNLLDKIKNMLSAIKDKFTRKGDKKEVDNDKKAKRKENVPVIISAVLFSLVFAGMIVNLVWFVEKDKKGESHLSSLCEYKPRENVQKGYLNGRYGAIPFFGELNNIHWDDAK